MYVFSCFVAFPPSFFCIVRYCRDRQPFLMMAKSIISGFLIGQAGSVYAKSIFSQIELISMTSRK